MPVELAASQQNPRQILLNQTQHRVLGPVSLLALLRYTAAASPPGVYS